MENLNPFTAITEQLVDLRKLILEIKTQQQEDFSNKYYTYQQVANLLHVDYQTIRNYVTAGFIECKKIGPRKKLIHHFEIFNEDKTLKMFKYRRKQE